MCCRFGGEDSDYYSWILFATIYGLPLEQPPPSDFRLDPDPLQFPAQAPAQVLVKQEPQHQGPSLDEHLEHAAAGCSHEVASGFSQVLAALTGSKVNCASDVTHWSICCITGVSHAACWSNIAFVAERTACCCTARQP